MGPETIKDFIAFVDKARALLPGPRVESVVSGFDNFVRAAEPLIIQQVKQALRDHKLQERLSILEKWIVPLEADILREAGIAGLEDRYTKLIAWMLFTPGFPNLALRCQKSWLRALGLPLLAEQIQEAVKPRDQVITCDGRPDLILSYRSPNHIVVVEAKTGSAEHKTPGDKPQTVSYPSAVRKLLGLSSDHPVTMVFLTTDKTSAESPEAISTSYETLVLSVASTLTPSELPPALYMAYSIVLTHLLTFAAEGGVNMSAGLRTIASFSGGDRTKVTDEAILSELGAIGPACRMLRRGARS